MKAKERIAKYGLEKYYRMQKKPVTKESLREYWQKFGVAIQEWQEKSEANAAASDAWRRSYYVGAGEVEAEELAHEEFKEPEPLPPKEPALPPKEPAARTKRKREGKKPTEAKESLQEKRDSVALALKRAGYSASEVAKALMDL